MLSTKSFNALLKTIEEPPEHVKFLLATTDPDKLPETVISRCLHFKLESISISSLSNHITNILSKENIPSDNDVSKIVIDEGVVTGDSEPLKIYAGTPDEKRSANAAD